MQISIGFLKPLHYSNQCNCRYQFARSIIDRIFGPKAHKEFPKDTRMDGNGCKGQGFYPAKMKGSAHEYWSEGVDLEAEYGEEVG